VSFAPPVVVPAQYSLNLSDSLVNFGHSVGYVCAGCRPCLGIERLGLKSLEKSNVSIGLVSVLGAQRLGLASVLKVE